MNLYVAFGFVASLVEGIPIIGLVFTISNRIGAAMWAHGQYPIPYSYSNLIHTYSVTIVTEPQIFYSQISRRSSISLRQKPPREPFRGHRSSLHLRRARRPDLRTPRSSHQLPEPRLRIQDKFRYSFIVLSDCSHTTTLSYLSLILNFVRTSMYTLGHLLQTQPIS